LTRLAEAFPEVANVHLDAVEHKDHIVFLHSVEDGPANQSYGLQVAQLAGVPPQVIRAARTRLAQLEQQAVDACAQGDLFATAAASATAAAPEHPALGLLRESDPDAMSPKQALELLYRLRQQLEH